MKTCFLPIFLFCFCFVSGATGVADTSTTAPFREYRLLFGHPHEMEAIAGMGVMLNKALSDMYYRGFGPRLPEKIGKITEVVWSVFWTFSASLWPHEFGHWARARQTGGDFVFTGFTFPFPTARMEIPDSYDPPENATLPAMGGFEINFLMRQQTHMELYRNGFGHADELVHACIQEVYYPFYTFVVAFADVDKPSTWTDTRGDPVECALSVYESYTGRPALRSDSTVDPDLIRHYRESIYLNVLWTALDPLLYQSIRAFGKNMKVNGGLVRPWMVLDKGDIKWTYGTYFNVSPLGYELYLTNYLNLEGRLYSLYVKTGRPYKNIGAGFSLSELYRLGRFSVGSSCDVWMQDVYGNGAAVTLSSDYRVFDNAGLTMKAGWKEQGYAVGRRVEESSLVLAGFFYRF